LNFKDIINTDENTKWVPAILRCKCGAEWSNSRSKVKEGSDLYLDMECRECSVKREKIENQKRLDRIRVKRLEEFESSIPPRFRGKLTVPKNESLIHSSCSIICGDFGTGKTWEAYTVAKELFSKGIVKTFKMTTEVGLLNNLKNDFDNLSLEVDKYNEIDLLIIDESGKNNDSVFNKAQLFDILNHRYEWEKKTILICNVSKKDDLIGLLPTATLDRFRECVVEMVGESKRYR